MLKLANSPKELNPLPLDCFNQVFFIVFDFDLCHQTDDEAIVNVSTVIKTVSDLILSVLYSVCFYEGHIVKSVL